jgi:hypothetical protein
MNKLFIVLFAISVATIGPLVAVAQPTQAEAAPIVSPEVKTPAPKLTPEQIIAEREKYVKEVRAVIAGHEKEPAEIVFKIIQRFKGVPAGRLPAIMDLPIHGN